MLKQLYHSKALLSIVQKSFTLSLSCLCKKRRVSIFGLFATALALGHTWFLPSKSDPHTHNHTNPHPRKHLMVFKAIRGKMVQLKFHVCVLLRLAPPFMRLAVIKFPLISELQWAGPRRLFWVGPGHSHCLLYRGQLLFSREKNRR